MGGNHGPETHARICPGGRLRLRARSVLFAGTNERHAAMLCGPPSTTIAAGGGWSHGYHRASGLDQHRRAGGRMWPEAERLYRSASFHDGVALEKGARGERTARLADLAAPGATGNAVSISRAVQGDAGDTVGRLRVRARSPRRARLA